MKPKLKRIADQYTKNLFTAAFNVCGNREDAEDAVQDTYMQYLKADKDFESEEHLRAWLFRVVINRAKNYSMSFWRRHKEPWEDYLETIPFDDSEECDLFESVMHLPEKYRVAIHLFYYEDYGTKEISNILKISESAVKSRLKRGREMLKNRIEGVTYDRTAEV